MTDNNVCIGFELFILELSQAQCIMTETNNVSLQDYIDYINGVGNLHLHV